MARALTPHAALRRYTEALVQRIPEWCEARRASPAFTSRAVASGEFRSRRITARGMEKGEPRAFLLDDDPSDIDFGRLPPSAGSDLLGAALRGELRIVPSIRVIETQFVVVVDVSRSMLAGFIARRVEAMTAADTAKLRALFFVVAAYLHLAAGLGFRVRVVYARGTRTFVESTGGTPRQVLLAVLARMRAMLLQGHRQTELPSVRREPFTLSSALRTPLAVAMRSVVLVVSDFLDPLPGYRAALASLTARHAVLLADVATAPDRMVPLPDQHAAQAVKGLLVPELGRHLEHDISGHALRIGPLKAWNRERREDWDGLRTLARHGGAAYDYVNTLVRDSDANGFARCYGLAFGHLRRLR